MTTPGVIGALTRKGADVSGIAARISERPELLPQVLDGLRSDVARTKFGCAKLLRVVSEKRPDLLYPMFDTFVGLLDSKNKILQWDAAFILARLAAVDSERRFESIFDKYFAPIAGPTMITAANVIGGAAAIARAKPRLTERITREILKVEKAKYRTTECRNVALGRAIESLDQFFDQVEDQEPVFGLVRRQLKNTRSATRRKAEEFLQKHSLSAANERR